MVNKNNISAIYSLSPLQEGMFYHKMLDNESSEYCIQDTIELIGSLELNYVEDSLMLLVIKYEVLKTAIAMPKKSTKVWQIILENRKIELNITDLTNVGAEEQELCISDIAKSDIDRGFDLEKDSLLRMTVIQCSDTKNIILWSSHHIIMDGWCSSLLFRDFIKYYGMRKKGISFEELKRNIEVESAGIATYQQYIQWLNNQDKEQGAAYWRKLLEGYDFTANILPMHMASPVDCQVAAESIQLSSELTIELKNMAAKLGITINSMLEASWGILLQKYSHGNDVVFGKIVSGRNVELDGIDQAVGLFINTIAVRLYTNHNTDLKSAAIDLFKQGLDSTEFEYYSLAEVQNETILGRNLIQTLFVFENYYVDSEGLEEGLEETGFIIDFKENREQTNYPLNLIVELKEVLNLEIMYNPSIYDAEEIFMLLKRLTIILNEMAVNPHKRIEELCLLDEQERLQVTEEFNRTSTVYPYDKTVVELFEEQVEKTPESTAIVFGEKALTYKELNDMANNAARSLKEIGVGREDFVAIFSGKSIEMIASIIGILKAGGAYVPIHWDSPEERVNFILKDCNARVLLKGKTVSEIKADIPAVLMDDELFKQRTQMNLEKLNEPSDLIYAMYTSGTTGKPKGVLIEHKNVVRLVKNTNYITLDESTVILQTGAISFDASTFEIWGSLLCGGKLCLLDNDMLMDPMAFKTQIRQHKVNTLWLTAALFNQIVLLDISMFDDLKFLLIGGEKLSEKHVSLFKLHNKNTRLINGYGPTENTTFTTTYEIPKNFDFIPIGTPIVNTRIYVMNNGSLCGIGMLGELCVAGDGVGRGYIKRDELTSERFLKNIFGEERLYRTGDLARWLPDGNIEYLGRIDKQVKIRGFRIEPGEVEEVIKNLNEVKNAIVIALEKNGEKYLCAYVVSDFKLDMTVLREKLKGELPAYMVPSFMVQIDSIPLTAQGKVNTRKLPEIEMNSMTDYVAPRNKIEEMVAGVFSEVLEVKKVGINDNFFELGGHSLKATRAINQMETVCGVRIPLKKLFENPTVLQLSKFISSYDGGSNSRLPKAEAKEYYNMTSVQMRMYTLWELDKVSIAYNMPVIINLSNNINLEKVQEALNKIIQRHEILRTSFHMKDGEFIQKIHHEYNFKLEIQESKANIRQLYNDFIKPFDLNCYPLIRAKVIREQERGYLFFDMHHIISDGASVGILIEEFMKLYRGETLEELQYQFKDYSESLLVHNFDEHKKFWFNLMDGELPITNLPYDMQKRKMQSHEAQTISFCLNKEIKDSIQMLCSKLKITEYMFFTGCLMILLGRMGKQEDIIVGSPISGRTSKETESMLGMFANTIVVRGYPSADKTFYRFINEIKEICLKAFEYQEYPFDELVENLNVNKSSSGNQLFDVMLVLQNNEQKEEKLNSLGGEILNIDVAKSKFPINVEIMNALNQYTVNVTYSSELFSKSIVGHMFNYYIKIMEQVTVSPYLHIKSLQLLNKEQLHCILNSIKGKQVMFPVNRCVYKLFEEQAAKNPESIAVYENDQFVTYSELNVKMNRLARTLRNNGIKPNDKIAIIAKRSTDLLVGIYAVLKSGAAYVPIDPSYPEERISYMLSDCSAKCVLIDEEYAPLCSGYQQIQLQDYNSYYYDGSNLEPINSPDDIAYVIYTSGTTGNPKGVMITHKTLMNYITWGSCKYIDDKKISMPLFTSVAFDLTVTTIYLPLVTGNSIVIYNEDYAVEKIAQDERIKLIKLTPSHLSMLKDTQSNCLSIKKFILGGEELLTEISDRIIEMYGPDTIIYNEYGPTEATVGCMIYEYTESNKSNMNSVLIGRPVDNVSLYVMNDGAICGAGMIGELCIGGNCLAIGYMNQEELTKEKFIENPYKNGERIYKTGDLVRWNAQGDMEYLGRIDEQVKIRGYRIELGEIESVIRKCSMVKNAVVVAQETEENRKVLCAYYVLADGVAHDINKQLIKDMKQCLPGYMIPSIMKQVTDIPLTINGKVDKRKLPKVDFDDLLTVNFIAPADEIEKKLCAIWQEVLGLNRIGIEDDFFELGGDSIHAIRIVSKVREIGYMLSITELMEHRTIAGIKAIMKKNDEGELSKYQTELSGYLELSPIQQNFFQKNLYNQNYYNQSVLLKAKSNLDTEAMDRVFHILTNYHDSLRSEFHDGNRLYVRPIGEKEDYVLSNIDLREIEENIIADKVTEACEMIQASFDITTGPLCKAAIIRTAECDLLVVCIHHLVVDGVSWRILIEDIQNLYRAALNNEEREIKLSPKTASYKVWTETLMRYKDSYELKIEQDYWMRTADIVRRIEENSPVRGWETATQGESDRLEFSLSKQESSNLLNDAEIAFNTTLDDLMVCGLVMAINKWRGDDMIAIDLESHGRELIENVPIDRTVGWFTSVYPVVFEVNSYDLRDCIIEVKETLHKISRNGIGYGVLRYLKGLKELDTKVEVSFNYLGTVDSEIKGDFEISDFYSGNGSANENRLWNPITIIGTTKDGVITYEFMWEKGIYSKEEIEILAYEYEQALIKIINYCMSREGVEYSSSDFGEDEWNDDEMREVLGYYED